MLANRLVQKIMSAIPDVVMNGDPNQRYPGTHTHNKHIDNSSAGRHDQKFMARFFPNSFSFAVYEGFCFSCASGC